MATSGADFNNDFNNDFGPAIPVGGPLFFNPGAEWQLIDRLAEPKPPMPEIPW